MAILVHWFKLAQTSPQAAVSWLTSFAQRYARTQEREPRVVLFMMRDEPWGFVSSLPSLPLPFSLSLLPSLFLSLTVS